MDELGFATLLLPTGDVGRHGTLDPFDYEHVAARWEETAKLVGRWPGRFAALGAHRPRRAACAACARRARRSPSPWVVGLLPPHAQLRPPLRPRRLLPVLRARAPSTTCPVVMQAGTSGGLMPSECGQPIGIDRPALYFPDTRFVLSHTGWPWVDEAVAMALKFPNVYLGTGAYPPRHWADRGACDFLRGPGRAKVMFGTNFPTVGHRARARRSSHELELDPRRRARAARRRPPAHVFTRLQPREESRAHDRQGLQHPAPAAGRGEHALLRVPAR